MWVGGSSILASVAIFNGQLDYDNSVKQDLPPEFFQLAKKVISTGIPEIYKSKDGFFVLLPSPNGPFSSPSTFTQEWMPIKVIRLERWQSGGITRCEFQNSFDNPENSSKKS